MNADWTVDDSMRYMDDFLQDDDVLEIHKQELEAAYRESYKAMEACIDRMEEIYNSPRSLEEMYAELEKMKAAHECQQN